MSESGVVNVPAPPAAEACAICGATLAGPIAVQMRQSSLRVCLSCGSWTYLPRPEGAGQAAIHDDQDYFDHPYFKLRRAITPAQRRRCRDIFRRLSEVVDITSLRGRRLLDIGCDTGTFLKVSQEEFGVLPVGIDVATRAVAVAREQGLEVHHTTLEEAPAELTGFPAAAAIDLIEHLPDPAAFLTEVRRRLQPGGLLYLETPNIGSLVYRFGQKLSAIAGGRPTGLIERLFPPHHIQYFTVESLRRLAQRVGFETMRLSTRVLPASDIAASKAALLVIGALQTCDRLRRSEILICAVLRRPLETSSLYRGASESMRANPDTPNSALPNTGGRVYNAQVA